MSDTCENIIEANNNGDFESYIPALRNGQFGFIDFGSSSGGSIEYCEKKFNRGKGLGIDNNLGKIALAKEKGRLVTKGDLRTVKIPEKCVSFCSAMDFLEHLPNLTFATSVIHTMAHSARDFIFIRHPSFEDIDYFASLGFKIDWSDWRGHTNMMKISDYERIFSEAGWSDYIIIPRRRVTNSDHPAIVPLDSPTNTVRYQPEICGPKNFTNFDKECFEQFDIYVKINPAIPEKEWAEVIKVSNR